MSFQSPRDNHDPLFHTFILKDTIMFSRAQHTLALAFVQEIIVLHRKVFVFRINFFYIYL